MKIKSYAFLPIILAALLGLSASAEPNVANAKLGSEKPFTEFAKIQIKNFDDEPLGRIMDLGVDLINGRIVEVLIASDSSLGLGTKIVAVPPRALIPDLTNEVYRLNVSVEMFKAAPAIDLSQWQDAGRSDRIAVAYYRFGQEPYFLENGVAPSTTAKRPKVALGYVERTSKLLDLPVGNLQHEKFGKVWSLTLDIPNGRILNVIVLAPGNFLTKSIIPATALSFNPARDGLLLDDTKSEYADEPRFVFTAAANGQDAYSERETYHGPRTNVALEQGNSYRDVDLTILINKNIRAAKVDRRHVQVGTLNGRVTIRGWVNSELEKNQIAAIAVAASRLEVVDDQITVGQPVAH